MRRLPPLNSLRAFEAAARLMSFSRAAQELHVTPGAISQQIRTLEDYLGLKLFKRQNRMILLTEQAQVCLPYLTDGLDRLAEAMEVVQRLTVDKPLTITVADAFASRWLMPRLRSFRESHPDIDVRIDASPDLMDLVREDIDVGIRFGDGIYPGLVTEFLMPMEVFPVCSPGLLESGPPLITPTDLQHYTLIHGDYFYFDASQPDWAMWLSTVGVDNVDSSRGLRFSQSEMVVQAAIEGQGVALAGSVTVSDDLKAGRLVQPFELRIPLTFAYYLAYAKSKAELPRLQNFRQWLLSQVKDSYDGAD